MSTEPLIKSRPSYAPVAIRPKATHHLFISTLEGWPALDPLWQSVPVAQCERVLFSTTDSVDDSIGFSLPIAQLGAAAGSMLSDAPLASAVYVAGHEAFLWDVRNLALSAGFAREQIQLAQPVDNRRRLFCTHCYSLTEDVTQSPHRCSGCNRLLLVRDHYSKLHAAYVGVQIDAEDPADVPATEELS